MFSFFKHKEQKEKQDPNKFVDKVAVGIVTKCLRVQGKWADYMQRRANRLSPRAKKYSLVLFCALSVSCSLYLIIEGFKGYSTKDLGVAPIHVPVHTTETGDEATRSPLLITKKEFERIERFRHNVDSLGKSATGTKVRDSMLSLRPGLMDSIRVIEKLYQLQNAKK
jgi:hypothetical protein